MKTSTTTGELFAALADAQGSFPIIPKNRTADMEKYTYDYADLSDVVEAIRPILKANGLSVVQSPEIFVSPGDDGGGVKILDLMTTRIAHKSGEWIEGAMRINLATAAQAQGSAITYARRYHECAMLGIVSDSDDDGALATAAYGEGTTRTKRQSAPSSSTSTRGTRGRSKVAAQDPETAGADQCAAPLRNKIVSALAKLDPPVRNNAVPAKLGALLNTDPVPAVKLTAAQGTQLAKTLGIK